MAAVLVIGRQRRPHARPSRKRQLTSGDVLAGYGQVDSYSLTTTTSDEPAETTHAELLSLGTPVRR
ncbi:hypothetical protein B586_01990 [Mycobacterium haemophilum DSM 44634]|uniref:Uncharacterized protein n=1 Tax=Mycobacterium haemophilum TaxID=29311 RepID=A0A0I9VFA3_9MYCO|nr:hypothetical protein B586_01990 [Mycobacterium haemophilum DSM 44634]KLO32248.1 hypothetical protein ABH39_07955 [Mycobacterium haemophilum]KLO36655.1 hypothetical protein ABH38_11870 [Mycobacterium haemophilum]KLO42583.1 hypothetical protein ABH37_10500 [Mycobacterium haemophilum]KLO55459.1 hypothetical protein ABH36_07475 [Mycobacterium haemophilum]